MMAEIYMTLAAIACVGVVWFYVVRPALEDWGMLQPREGAEEVSTITPSARPAVMSSTPSRPIPSPGLSLETDARQTPDRPMMPVPTRDQMLDIFKVLRAAGVGRDTIGPAWRAAGLPLNNNLWSDAAPDPDEHLILTPIAQRPVDGKYYPNNPELEYKGPEV
jgi:hypothetical protein